MNGSDTITTLTLDEKINVYHLVTNAFSICFSKEENTLTNLEAQILS